MIRTDEEGNIYTVYDCPNCDNELEGIETVYRDRKTGEVIGCTRCIEEEIAAVLEG